MREVRERIGERARGAWREPDRDDDRRLAGLVHGPPRRPPGKTTLEYEWDDGAWGATWHFYQDRDVAEDEARRRSQVAYLAYYGKQSILGWDRVTIRDLDAAYEDVGGVISAINEQREG